MKEFYRLEKERERILKKDENSINILSLIFLWLIILGFVGTMLLLILCGFKFVLCGFKFDTIIKIIGICVCLDLCMMIIIFIYMMVKYNIKNGLNEIVGKQQDIIEKDWGEAIKINQAYNFLRNIETSKKMLKKAKIRV